MTIEAPPLYKLTDPKGGPIHGGMGAWSLPRGKRPGAWREVTGKVVPCQNGLHLLRPQDIGSWLHAGVVWEAEAGTERIDHGDKIVARKARLVRKVGVLDDKTLRLLAADFAEHVLPFFEKKYPGDMRPREAIAAARAYARSEITIGELREKQDAAYDAAAAAYAAADAAAYDAAAAAAYAAADAADAADAAAYAAYAYAAAAAAAAYDAAAAAAYAAAAYAAADAADAAADAAAAAYDDAARSSERAWQTRRICEVLGIPMEEAA